MSYFEYKGSATRSNLRHFRESFAGEIFYALKANPFPGIITDLLNAGVDGFDVASPEEIRAVRNYSATVPLIYTHPIKTPANIQEAWGDWGIRAFAIDCEAEWMKIFQLCHPIEEAEIFIRTKTAGSTENALIKLDDKFGADLPVALDLASKIKQSGAAVSICFHTGSQQTDAAAYTQAMRYIAQALQDHGILPNRISIGGGFPVDYHEVEVPDLGSLLPDFNQLRLEFPVLHSVKFMAEPGRYLAADSMDLITNVILVDCDRVFLDDGIYGSLMDCALLKTRFPVSMRYPSPLAQTGLFKLFGPTCDSLDQLPGLYELPTTLSAGDQIRISKVGAYGSALTNNFNGLCPRPSVEISSEHFSDAPAMTAASSQIA